MLPRLWLLVGSDRPTDRQTDRPTDRQCHLLSCPGQLKTRVNSRPLQFSKKTPAAAHALFPTDRTTEDRDHLLSPRICDGRAFATIPRSISFFMNNVYGVCSQGKIFRYIRCSWKWNQHFSSCDIHYYIFAFLCISNVQELWYLFVGEVISPYHPDHLSDSF